MIGDRIKQVRKLKGLTQKEVCDLTGTNQGNFSRIEKGLFEPNMSFLQLFSKNYGINIHWLVSGEGNMFLSDSPGEDLPKEKFLDDDIQNAEKWRQKKNQEFMAQFRKIKDYTNNNRDVEPVYSDDVWELAVVGDISAGEPLPVFYTDDMQYIPVSKKILDIPENYYCFRVNGDSMHPEINHNDYVVISKVFDYDDLDGRIVAVRSSEGITLKRLLIDYKNKLSLLFPINQRFKPILLDDTSEVIGVIKALFRKYY